MFPACEAPPAPTPEDLRPANRPYRPRGAALDLFYARDREVLAGGPAGTGKSRACLEKLYLCCEKYPGVRCLITRKTRESITQSALVTWEEKVLPEGSPLARGAARNQRKEYRFPNGSTVIVAGLRQSSRDNTQQVMSTEYDLIYVQEAIELTEDEWEKLTTRLRNGRMPYQQLLADTNPASPTHWLKRRCDAGGCRYLDSRHEDNPTLWDADAGRWTDGGAFYIAALDALTGPRRLRLRHGRWVQSEGVVYDGWDAGLHLVDRFDVPADWPRYWSIDFGFTNPFACQWWAEDPDGRLYLYRELYRTQTLVEDHAREIARLSAGEPRPRAVVCDHDAEGRATLEKHLRLPTSAANKDVQAGVQAVAARLRKAGDGRPRLSVLRDALVARDPVLAETRRPCGFLEEIDGYVWDQSGTKGPKEEPLKLNDHAMDAARYLVMHREAGTRWVPPTPVKVPGRQAWDERRHASPLFPGGGRPGRDGGGRP